jgi:DNA-binding XRE family transcriptional regulator
MPKGIPNDPNARNKGGYHLSHDKEALKARLKDMEERHKERVQAMREHMQRIERRQKMVGDLKKWADKRKLEIIDLLWMAHQLRPKRADKPVKSKKPLKPGSRLLMANGKLVAPKGDPEFRTRIKAARLEKGWSSMVVSKKLGVSHSAITAWESGRYVPKEETRQKLVELLGLPVRLGADATKEMEAAMAGRNGAAA